MGVSLGAVARLGGSIMQEKTFMAWYRIAFKRAVKGLPPLSLYNLAQDDKRRYAYLIGQLRGERSKGGFFYG